jgi:hypothetical protein
VSDTRRPTGQGGATMTAAPRRGAVTTRPVPAPGTEPRWPAVLSAVLAVLMTLASLGGLFIHGLYLDNTWSTAAYRGTDLATLLAAVPVLVIALVLARHGSDRARLVWLGVLAYNVYNYAFYLFGTAFNDFFMLYAALLSLSLIALVGAAPGVLVIPHAVRPGPARLVGGYMAVVGVMFAAMWITQAVQYLASGTVPKVIGDSGIHTSIVFALDLTLVIPALVIGAGLLWRCQRAGIVLGVTMNVVGALYMIALVLAGAFQASAGVAGASWAVPPYIELATTSVAACWLLLRFTRKTAASDSERLSAIGPSSASGWRPVDQPGTDSKLVRTG